MWQRPPRRLITGHDENGKAIFLDIGVPPTLIADDFTGVSWYEIWKTSETPVPLPPSEPDPTANVRIAMPTPNGSLVRIAEFQPGKQMTMTEEARAAALKAFEGMGGDSSDQNKHGVPHPMMHKTETIDFGLVIEGEVVLILDDSEQQLRPGDVVIQRGTSHAWENRSDGICRMAFFLIDGTFVGASKP